MNKLAIAATVLMLAGFGCDSSTTVDTSADVAAPPTTTPSGTQPAEPAEPAEPGINLNVDTKLSLKSNVQIAASGVFVPSKITVKKGTTVTWKNDGDVNVWIASAPHPTHTDYPGFDSMAAVTAGQSYSFTFDKVGSWNYHDHLHPTVYGTVVVTE